MAEVDKLLNLEVIDEEPKNIDYAIEEETDTEMEELETKYTGTVHRVIDGDTFEIWIRGKLETIRAIGMNTPETDFDYGKGQDIYGEEAKFTTLFTIQGQEVTLELDLIPADIYGRIQCWVWHENKLLQETIVEQGHAYLDTFIPNVHYQDVLVEAQKRARENKAGLWSVDFFSQAPEEAFGLHLANTFLEIIYENIVEASPKEFTMARRQGIGSSDIATVMGLSHYETPQQLLYEKLQTHMTKEEYQTSQIPHVQIGNNAEPLVLEKLKQFFRPGIWKPKHMFKIQQFPFLLLNYDAVTGSHEQYYPIEIKIISSLRSIRFNLSKYYFNEYEGRRPLPQDVSESDVPAAAKAAHYGIPVEAYAQVQVQMLGLNAPYGFVAVMPEDNWTVYVFHVWKDEKFMSEMVFACSHFWDMVQRSKGRDLRNWITIHESYQ